MQEELPLQDLPSSKPNEAHPSCAAEARLVRHWTLTGRKWKAPRKSRRCNNLLLAVGLLELANALDFAANVWNAVPPPPIAMTFMALGATGALLLLAFAAFDIPRARHNVSLLRQERRRLEKLRHQPALAAKSGLTAVDLGAHLDINHRELGNEVIDRSLMASFLGFGALTVGIGTYLAIDGSNPTSYLASNVITGYLGNVPAALYGLINAFWCVYGWRRAQSHANAASTIGHDDLADEIRNHSNRVKHHALVNAISGILGGAGSLMTASAYIKPVGVWGYVILVPCILSTIYANRVWRWRINYDREVFDTNLTGKAQALNHARRAILEEHKLQEYCRSLKPKRPLEKAHGAIDPDRLASFLLEYFDGQAESLEASMKALGSSGDTTPERQDEMKDLRDIRSSQAREDFSANERRLNEVNALRISLRSFEPGSEKQQNPHSIARALYDFLIMTDLFPELCARAANDRILSSVCIPTGRKVQAETVVDAEEMWARIEGSWTLCERFAALGRRVMQVEGMDQAQGRKRYYCELVGAFFRQ